MAISHTFSIYTRTPIMRVVKWLLIGCGLLLVTDSIFHLIHATGPNYEYMILGACFILIGFGFEYYFGSITINSDAITHQRKKTGLMPEKYQQVRWNDIRKVALYSSSIRLTDHSYTTIKFPLPNYTRSQFRDLKNMLAEQAEQHNAEFEIRNWW